MSPRGFQERHLGVVGSFLSSAGGKISLQSAQLILAAYDCASSSCYSKIAEISADAANETTQVFASNRQGFAELQGVARVPNDQGSASALSGIELSSDASDSFDTLADSSGQYAMIVPLQDPNFDYSHAVVEIIDPFSQGSLGSQIVDLSGLNTNQPVQIPTINEIPCIDDDADNPDQDDPDCDNLGYLNFSVTDRMVAFHSRGINDVFRVSINH